MADYLFVPQSVLDRWSEQGKVQVDGHVLTILGDNKSFALASAVRFIKMEAGDDLSNLLQKVKTTEALKAMGAEHYMESVIYQDAAYQVQQGFLADANALRRAAAASQGAAKKPAPAPAPTQAAAPHLHSPIPTPLAPAPAVAAKAPETGPEKAVRQEGEQDLLAQFLLENLQ